MSAPPVLVTGASGFIGWHVVRELLRAGRPVRALVRPSSDVRHLRPLGVEIFVADLLRAESLVPAVRGISAVVHLAGVMQGSDEESYRRVNVDGTMNLLDVVSREARGIGRFVFVSSLAAVGPTFGGRPLDEEALPEPITPYGRTKLEAEAAVTERKDDLPVTIFRPPLVYGSRDRSLLPYFRVVRAGVVLLPEGGEQPLSVIHASDLAAAIVRAVERDHASGSTFHIADGPARRFRDVAEAIRIAHGTPAVTVSVSRRWLLAARGVGRIVVRRGGRLPLWVHPDALELVLAPGWSCTNTRLRETLAWEPRVALLDGLRETVDWYRDAGWLLRPWGGLMNRRDRRPSKAPPGSAQG